MYIKYDCLGKWVTTGICKFRVSTIVTYRKHIDIFSVFLRAHALINAFSHTHEPIYNLSGSNKTNQIICSCETNLAHDQIHFCYNHFSTINYTYFLFHFVFLHSQVTCCQTYRPAYMPSTKKLDYITRCNNVRLRWHTCLLYLSSWQIWQISSSGKVDYNRKPKI